MALTFHATDRDSDSKAPVAPRTVHFSATEEEGQGEGESVAKAPLLQMHEIVPSLPCNNPTATSFTLISSSCST